MFPNKHHLPIADSRSSQGKDEPEEYTSKDWFSWPPGELGCFGALKSIRIVTQSFFKTFWE